EGTAAVEDGTWHAQLVQVAAQTSERIRAARQQRQPLFERLALIELLLHVHQQRVQRTCLASLAQLGDERGRVYSGRLGVEEVGMQSAQRAFHASTQSVVALDRLDAAQAVEIGRLGSRHCTRGCPAWQGLKELMWLDRQQQRWQLGLGEQRGVVGRMHRRNKATIARLELG